jgi:TRAP-type mannitol/chloroaromatic compound transport system substrate-binding protein
MKRLNSGIVTAALLCGALGLPASALAIDIAYRNFSGSAGLGPPGDAYAAKMLSVTTATLGAGSVVNFVRLPGTPAIPSQFGGSIIRAVEAGSINGGFDAAYNSGSELNPAWGFIYNSGVPFGPSFDEFMGFLYGKSVGGTQTGLELMQEILALNNKNVVAIPVAGAPDQLSGYFPMPIGDARGTRGIGLTGLCTSGWTIRYLPPGENVIKQACNDLVASGQIPAVNLGFIAAVPGGGSLLDGLRNGTLQGFEFATPVDDLSQFFKATENPGTLGAPFAHFPGWQQQYLVTWMIINKDVWNSLTPAQQVLAQSVARDNLISTYGETLRKQGDALKAILSADADGDGSSDIVLADWGKRAQGQLRDATIRFLNARTTDPALSAADRADYTRILEAFRKYVLANDAYWDDRGVTPTMRFDNWENVLGEHWALEGCP